MGSAPGRGEPQLITPSATGKFQLEVEAQAQAQAAFKLLVQPELTVGLTRAVPVTGTASGT